MNLANKLTIFRMVLVPIIVIIPFFPIEKEVLSVVGESIKKQNNIRLLKLPDKMRKVFLKTDEEPYNAMIKKLESAKDTQMPTKENWFLNYEVLDMVLKQSDNPDYNYIHKQFVQNTLKKLCGAWESYFEQMKDVLPNMLLASFMGICVSLISMLNLPAFVTLAIQVMVGTLVYVTVAIISKNDNCFYIWNIIKPLIGRLIVKKR